MASSLTPTPPPPTTTTTTTTTTNQSRDLHRQKKKKKPNSKHNHNNHHHHQHNNTTKWKSETQQQLYSSKLRQALTTVPLSGDAPWRGKAVRDAADRVLATAARGRTRWSRAILANRLKLKFMKKQHKRKRIAEPVGPGRSRKPRLSVLRLKGKRVVPSVQRKVRVLGKLVPGCRKEPLPVILEETIDYIPALEMQVRAMTALANLFLGSSSSSASAP